MTKRTGWMHLRRGIKRVESLESRLFLAGVTDFNGDGRFDTTDVDQLTVAISTNFDQLRYDVDGNGVVDSSDLDSWRSIAAEQNGMSEPYLHGDANLDGLVDSADLNQLALNWRTGSREWSRGNFMPDNQVDGKDLNRLALNWLESVPQKVSSQGALTIGNRVDAGRGPVSIGVADFDGDGHSDLVNANLFSNSVTVLLGRGDGRFLTGKSYPLSDEGPNSIVTGDFNGDGAADIATANASSNNVTVLLGLGDGRLSVPLVFRATTSENRKPSSIRTGDFDGDGNLDLAVIEEDANQRNNVAVLLGQGVGTFLPPRRALTTTVDFQSMAVGDFDGDASDDLAIISQDSDSVRIFGANGDGTFALQRQLATGRRPYDVAVADFDGDGNADLVSANAVSDDVSVFIGRGNGSFVTQPRVAVGDFPSVVTTGDFNGDGTVDVVTVNLFSSDISLLIGKRDGDFFAQRRVEGGEFSTIAVAADFNADGNTDLAKSIFSKDEILVFLGQSDD